MHEEKIDRIKRKLLRLQEVGHDEFYFFDSRFKDVLAECEREMGYARRCPGIKITAFEEELDKVLVNL